MYRRARHGRKCWCPNAAAQVPLRRTRRGKTNRPLHSKDRPLLRSSRAATATGDMRREIRVSRI